MAALSNAAGVGGGAVFVPLFCILLSMDIKAASALSQAAIAAGAAGSVACSMTRRHPEHPATPLIAFDLALALLPLLLLGVSCGVLLNLALPAWLVTLLLIPLLALLALRTACMGLRMRRAEKQLKAQQQGLLRSPEGQAEVSLEGQISQSPEKMAVELSSRDITPAASPTKQAVSSDSAGRPGVTRPGSTSSSPDDRGTADEASSAWRILAAGADAVRPGTLQDACCEVHPSSPRPKTEPAGQQQAKGRQGGFERAPAAWPSVPDGTWPNLGQMALLWLGFAAVQVSNGR